MRILLTGASGYIGGTVAAALLAAGHRVAGLVRSEERASQVRALGVEPVLGTLSDAAVLAKAARSADAVINAANADDRGAVEALLAAIEGSGKGFIQTSGSGIVADAAGGAATTAVYEDETPVHPLPARAARVALNATVLDAAARGVRAAVIAPPMIYGRGAGVNPSSIQVPRMIAAAKKAGVGRYIGAGENVWSNVHVDDLADLYLRVLDSAPAGAFYYAENGENSMREIAAAISRMLGFGGRTSAMTIEEAVAEYGEPATLYSLGSNSRVRAVRARREIGWSPRRPSLLEELARGDRGPDPRIEEGGG
jgi:nucleoside-diphosphate-sugar epimerase